jgi:hypothetical protein
MLKYYSDATTLYVISVSCHVPNKVHVHTSEIIVDIPSQIKDKNTLLQINVENKLAE